MSAVPIKAAAPASAAVAVRGPAAPAQKPQPQPLARIEAHYRKFLQARWVGLIVRAAIVTTVVFFIVPSVLIRPDYSLLGVLRTLAIGPLVYILAVHPVLLARRAWIISPPQLPTPTSAPRVLFSTFTPRVLALVASYWALGFIFAIAVAATLNARFDVQLSWLSPSARYPWHGNERLWFLVLGNTTFFGGLAVRDVLRSHIGPFYPSARLRFPDAVRRSLLAGVPKVLADASLAVTWTTAYTAAYLLLRVWVWRTAVTYLPFLRPLAINFAKASRSNMSYSLAWYLLVLQLTTLLAIHPALAVLNDYLCQPLPFSHFTAKSPLSPDRYLLTALQTQNEWYKNLTVLELQRVAHTPKRRQEIFADTSRPALTHEVYKALLLALGDTYAALTVSTRPAAAPASAPPSAPDAHTIPLQSGDIFKPAPRTGIKALVGSVLDAKPVPTPQPVLEAAKTVHAAEKAAIKRIEAPVVAAEAWAESTPLLGPMFAGARFARGGFAQWAGAAWAQRKVAAALPQPDRLARLVDILATLTVASADEDTYGYVQAVLPSVLEAMVRLRTGADALGAQLLPLSAKVGRDADADVRVEIARVTEVLDSGIRRIGERFGTSLTAFRFPPNIAQVLTEVCRET